MFFLKNFIKNNYFRIIEIFILFVISLTPLLWFSPDHMVLGLDSGYPINFINHFNTRLFTWFSPFNFGTDFTAVTGQIPQFALLAFIKIIGVSTYSVQKVTFVFWFFTMALSMYLFTSYLYKDKKYWIIRLVAVFLYVYNFHLFSFWVQGAQATFSAYILLPVVTLLLFKFFNEEISPIKTAVLINIAYLFFNMGGIYGLPLAGPTIISAITIFIFYAALNFKKDIKKFMKRFVLLIAFFLPLMFLLNAYSLLPFISSFGQQFSDTVKSEGGIESTVYWAKYISTYDSYINLFRLQGDNSWYNNPYHYSKIFFNNPLLIFTSFLFPTLTYVSYFLVKIRKEKLIVLFFMLLSLVAIFFSAGIHYPFGFIYEAMMRYVPGFAAFRSPYYKFIPALYFSFSILVGISVYYLSQKTKIKYYFGVLFLLIILMYHYPFFQKEWATIDKPLSSMVKVPDYILEFGKMKNDSPLDYRTLMVPPFYNYHALKAYEWGYYSISSISLAITDKQFVYNNQSGFFEGAYLIDELYAKLREEKHDEFRELAKKLYIKEILLTEDIAFNYRDALTENPEIYKKILDDKRFFQVVWRKGKWTLYSINSIKEINKISVKNSLKTFYAGNHWDFTGLFSSIGDSFVIQGEQFKDLISRVPTSEKVIPYKCISCEISKVNKQKIEKFSVKMLPGSAIYPLKLYSEKIIEGKTQTKEQLLDLYLGFSLKRIMELDRLNELPVKKNSTDNWIEALKLLDFYWKKMAVIAEQNYLKTDNFFMLSKIYDYGTYEKDVLIKLYLNKTQNEPLKSIFSSSLWSMQKVLSDIDKIFKEYDWSKTFAYDIKTESLKARDIEFNVTTLPRDDSNRPLFPATYLLDGQLLSVSEKQQKEFKISNVDPKFSKLILFFQNLPDNILSLQKTRVIFPEKTENCLYSQIKNYRWDKKYTIRTKIQDIESQPIIYVKRDYGVFATESTPILKSNYFNPDNVFLPELKKNGDGVIFNFSGKQNDFGASVYLCSSILTDPSSVFKEIEFREVFEPKIYNKESLILKQITPPEISFKKINPTKYLVSVKNAKGPYTLEFLEGFSPLWKLNFVNSSDEVSDNHFILNGYANGWYIEKSGNYSLEINFYTQKFLKIGIIISLATLVLIAIFIFGKNANKKND